MGILQGAKTRVVVMSSLLLASLLARVNFQTSFCLTVFTFRYINEGFTSNLCRFASFNEVFLESAAVVHVQVSHLI